MNPDVRELTAALRQQAHALGFEHCGVAPAERLDVEAARLSDWLQRGYGADMEWMARARERRADPRLHLPGARSVVCVARNYYTAHSMEERPGRGKISRYAWGEDYHRVMGDSLRLLLKWLQARVPGCRGTIAVDTSPVMDKAWAVRAGLGWIGKHSSLINPVHGSWIFLGELLVDTPLDCPSVPVADQCGTCTLCIDQCPTGAIVGPRVVDSRRCISYQTIEFRGETLQQEPDGWVFGCDVCQDVCPWNQRPVETPDPRFQPRPGMLNPELETLCSLPEEGFQSWTRGSAVRRTGRRGLVRNARHVRARQASS